MSKGTNWLKRIASCAWEGRGDVTGKQRALLLLVVETRWALIPIIIIIIMVGGVWEELYGAEVVCWLFKRQWLRWFKYRWSECRWLRYRWRGEADFAGSNADAGDSDALNWDAVDSDVAEEVDYPASQLQSTWAAPIAIVSEHSNSGRQNSGSSTVWLSLLFRITPDTAFVFELATDWY